LAQPYLTDSELKQFKERIEATYNLGKEHQVKLTHTGNSEEYTMADIFLLLYSDRFDKSSRRLYWATCALIGLTIILAILTVILAYK
jgi:hypothetical protein